MSLPISVVFASVELADLLCDVSKIPLEEVKIVEADEEPTMSPPISVVFASVELADLLCDVTKIPLEEVKIAVVFEKTIALLLMLTTIGAVSGETPVVVKGKEGLTVSPLNPFDNVVDIATDMFFEEESAERDEGDSSREVSIAVVMLLDVVGDEVIVVVLGASGDAVADDQGKMVEEA